MSTGNVENFEKYRRERNRRRHDAGPLRPMGENAAVLRELEAVEREEVRDQQLSREVHEFFADATRTAASIVSQVAETAESQLEASVRAEMSDFLEATIRRAQQFMVLMKRIDGGVAQTDLETNMRNLVGPVLDAFRYEGTAQLDDKHLGQDLSGGEPFPGVDAPRTLDTSPGPQASQSSSIDDHLVAECVTDDDGSQDASDPWNAWFETIRTDSALLQTTLKVLVRGGVMEKSQAKAIYRHLR